MLADATIMSSWGTPRVNYNFGSGGTVGFELHSGANFVFCDGHVETVRYVDFANNPQWYDDDYQGF
jgi:prepilin-type processing-associated H-X9-DG protein